MVRSMVLFTFLGIAVFAGFLYFRLGGYKSVEFKIEDKGIIQLIGKSHLGAYYKIAPIITEVESKFKSVQLDCTQTFGYYLDDPEKVEEDRQRSIGGCVWEIQDSTPTAAGEKKAKPIPEIKDLQTESVLLQANSYLVGRFYGAPSIGPMKVYPAAKDFFREKGWSFPSKVLEIYRLEPDQGVLTEYYFTIPSAAK